MAHGGLTGRFALVFRSRVSQSRFPAVLKRPPLPVIEWAGQRPGPWKVPHAPPPALRSEH
ncbi:hypothetical protein [Azospirillum endophyticum]